jgi:hypothetical protein
MAVKYRLPRKSDISRLSGFTFDKSLQGKFSTNRLKGGLQPSNVARKGAKVHLRMAGKLLHAPEKALSITDKLIRPDMPRKLARGFSASAKAMGYVQGLTGKGGKFVTAFEKASVSLEATAIKADTIKKTVGKVSKVSKKVSPFIDAGLKITETVISKEASNQAIIDEVLSPDSQIGQRLYKSIMSILKIPEEMRDKYIFAISEVLNSDEVKNFQGNIPDVIEFIKEQIEGVDPASAEQISEVLEQVKQGLSKYLDNDDKNVNDVVEAFSKSINFKQIVDRVSKNVDLEKVVDVAFDAYERVNNQSNRAFG